MVARGKAMARRIAVAIPARNEAGNLPSCLKALAAAARASPAGEITVVVLANNCDDDTVASVIRTASDLRTEIIERQLPPPLAHAGQARRLAFDAAAALLRGPGDILLSTDADTVVAEDWLVRTLDHFDSGFDAVAGLARLKLSELRLMPPDLRRRLSALRRYDWATSYLRAIRDPAEPWPRHFYEGGASMALTLAAYRGVGGAPTPAVGEDKALFDAVRAIGGRVRHPTDVQVRTSPRLDGRAPGGTSDTLATWARLADDEAIAGVQGIAECLNLKASGPRQLTFKTLPAEVERARRLVRIDRQSRGLAAAG